MFSLDGKGALVTGATGGIGGAIVRALHTQGATVAMSGTRKEKLQDLAAELKDRVHILPCDLSDREAVGKLAGEAEAAVGELDILVNNAGIGAMGLFEQADPQRVRKLMEVNFFALVEMTRLALPVLKQGNKPMIVNVSSILGRRGAPHNSEYSASKFAVAGFSESIRAELAGQGVDVLVVSPGTTATEFFDKVIQKTGEPTWPEHAPVTSEAVAKSMVRAIRRGSHEIIPYRWGKLLCWLNRLSPRLVDALMARYV